jgi:N-acetylgalactosamine-6-phosphate deacetylase
MPDGRYTLCGEEVTMQNGVVRTAWWPGGQHAVAGCRGRNMVEHAG